MFGGNLETLSDANAWYRVSGGLVYSRNHGEPLGRVVSSHSSQRAAGRVVARLMAVAAVHAD
jgi:hypothetical protein